MPAPLDPTRLPLDEAARLLTAAAGQNISPEILRFHVAHGAPTNADGTLHLVHYAAWLLAAAAA